MKGLFTLAVAAVVLHAAASQQAATPHLRGPAADKGGLEIQQECNAQCPNGFSRCFVGANGAPKATCKAARADKGGLEIQQECNAQCPNGFSRCILGANGAARATCKD